MRKDLTNPIVVRGVNLYYKSRDEKYLEEWYQLTKKLAVHLLPLVSASELSPLRKRT